MKKAEGIIYQGPMIDAHSHLQPALIQLESVPTLISEAGLEKIILLVPPPLLEQASKMDPDHIVPFFHVGTAFVGQEGSTNKEVIPGIQQALESGLAKGIGELVMRHRRRPESLTDDSTPADHSLLLEVYDLATKYNVPVIMHLEHAYSEELERALAHNREAKIIWAHYGDASPQFVRAMLTRNPNLYADLSAINPVLGYRHPELAPADPEGNLRPGWKDLFLDFSDRFVFGIDMGVREARYQNSPDVVKYYRKVLGQLPAPVAKKIAHDNILALLGQ